MSIKPITKPYRVASGEGLADVWWKSGRITVKTAGAETSNAFAQLETDDPRGAGVEKASDAADVYRGARARIGIQQI